MQIDLRPVRTFLRKFPEFLAMFLFKGNQHAFDVFACADQIVFIIWAGAGVLQFIQRTDFNAVGASRNGTDLEQTENGMTAFVDNLENFRAGALASAFDLFLDIRRRGDTPKVLWRDNLFY